MKLTYAQIIAQHQILQKTEAAPVAPERVEQVKAFIADVVAAGVDIADSRQREHLRSILRYWSAWVHDRTKEFPPSQLTPFAGTGAGGAPARIVGLTLWLIAGLALVGVIALGLAGVLGVAGLSALRATGTPEPSATQVIAPEVTSTPTLELLPSPTLTPGPVLTTTATPPPTPTPKPKLVVVQKLLLDFSSPGTLPSGPLDVPPTAETSGMIQFVNVSNPHVWVLVCKRDEPSAPCAISTLELSPEGTWSSSIAIGSPGPEDDCAEFDVIFAVVDSNTNSELTVLYPPESTIRRDQVPWERFLDSQLIPTKRGLSADSQPICK
jgi:hypothetical protein